MARRRRGRQVMIGNSSERQVDLTLEQAQWLFQSSMAISIPKPLCELRKIDEVELSIAKHETDALWADLLAQSPIAQERRDDRRFYMFGDPKLSEAIEEKGETTGYEFKDDQHVVSVRLSEAAVRGACWVLFVFLHPPVIDKDGKPIKASVAAVTAHEVCWPVARALRKEGVVRELLGLNSERKDRWGKDDPPADQKPREQEAVAS